MEQVDTRRIRRVLERVYPPPPPPPPGPNPGDPPPEPFPPPPPPRPEEEACRLLNTERELQGALQRAMGRSMECRRALRDILRRCGDRERRLRARCFLTGGLRPPPPQPRRGGTGVLSSLRLAERLLRELAGDYRAIAHGQPERGELYRRFSRECARDAETVESLVERALR